MRSNSRPMGTPSPISNVNVYSDNPEQYAREFRAVPAPEDIKTAEAPCHEEQGLITQLETLAQAGVDIAERAAEPVTPWDVARMGVKLLAWIARKLR